MDISQFLKFRKPENAELRRLTTLAKEDATEDLIAAFNTGQIVLPGRAAAPSGGLDIGALLALLPQILAILGPLLAGLMKKAPPVVVAPPPVEEEDEDDTPAPPPTPKVARITGGKAHFTGLTERGAQGPRVGNWKDIIGGSDNAPNDCRFELDCTPSDGKKDFGPTVNGVPDPRWAGQPGNSPDWAFPMRLFFTYEGPGSADLVHEYANFGCTPRIRVRQPEGSSGSLTEVYFKGPDYGDGNPVIIPVADGPIHIGRH